MKKITKRDVLFIFVGMLLMLAVDIIFNWDSAKQSFMKGLNDAPGKQEQTK